MTEPIILQLGKNQTIQIPVKVLSVNGQVGVVVLDAEDVGAVALGNVGDGNVLNYLTFSYDGDAVTLEKSYINVKNGNTYEQQENMPLANGTTAGMMSPADVVTLELHTNQIAALQGQTVRLLYTASTTPTAQEIEQFVISAGYTEDKWTSIAVVVAQTFHVWHYYDNTTAWQDDGVDTVAQFTNTTPGIIKGAAADGKVYAESDGTGSVYGWDALNTTIDNLGNDVQEVTEAVNAKLDKANPTGTGALSMNRKANSAVGSRSVVLGNSNVAEGQASIALGTNNVINLLNGAALAAVALGAGLQAFGNCQIVMGRYNVGLSEPQSEGSNYPYYPLVFGWGTSSNPKNLLWLDRKGNLYLTGNIVTGGTHLASDTMTFYVAPKNGGSGSLLGISDVVTLPYCTTFADAIAVKLLTNSRTRNSDGTTTVNSNLIPLIRTSSGQVQIYSNYGNYGDSLGYRYATMYHDAAFTQVVNASDTIEAGATYYIETLYVPAP